MSSVPATFCLYVSENPMLFVYILIWYMNQVSYSCFQTYLSILFSAIPTQNLPGKMGPFSMVGLEFILLNRYLILLCLLYSQIKQLQMWLQVP